MKADEKTSKQRTPTRREIHLHHQDVKSDWYVSVAKQTTR